MTASDNASSRKPEAQRRRAVDGASALIASTPSVAASRGEHAVALARPMLGAQMVGDPWITDLGTQDPLFARRACQYGAGLLRQSEPTFGVDLSHLIASFEPPATVVFWSMAKKTAARRRAAVMAPGAPPPCKKIIVATIVLPGTVMRFRIGQRAAA